MAVAFNPSEEVREGAQHHQNHNHHHQQQQQHHHQTQASQANNAQPEPTSSSDSSANSSPSSSASSSTNSSPGAVTGPMPIPQAQFAHPNAPVYYYPAGSPLVPPHSPVPPTATVYQQRQYNNEELIQAICEALHRCSNGSLPPPSPSCSPFTPANVPLTPFAVYGQTPTASPAETNVFFPQNMPATPHAYYSHPQQHQQQPPHTPISHPSYYPVPQQQPLYFQYHTVQPSHSTYSTVTPAPTPVTPSHAPAATTPAFPSSMTNTPQLQIPRRAARRIRLSSRSEASPSTSQRVPMESSESDADPVQCHAMDNYLTMVDANNNNSASSDSDNPVHDHLTYLEARERLEEFPGRVPQRRKKSMSTSSASASAAKKAALISLQSDTDCSSPEIITSQKQQSRQMSKTSELSAKNSASSTPLSATTNASHMGQEGSSRSSSSSRNKCTTKNKEQCLSWSLVTAFVLVVGCGFFASR